MTTIAFLPNGEEIDADDLTNCRRCGGYARPYKIECEVPQRYCYQCGEWRLGYQYPCLHDQARCTECGFVQDDETEPQLGSIIVEEL